MHACIYRDTLRSQHVRLYNSTVRLRRLPAQSPSRVCWIKFLYQVRVRLSARRRGQHSGTLSDAVEVAAVHLVCWSRSATLTRMTCIVEGLRVDHGLRWLTDVGAWAVPALLQATGAGGMNVAGTSSWHAGATCRYDKNGMHR